MKRGDLVESRGLGWQGRVTSFGKGGTVLMQWETGPLAGRPARVPKDTLRRIER